MFQVERSSVRVDFAEASGKSLRYVLALAKEIKAQFVVLQVVEKNAEKYSLIFSVALLERWPFSGGSVAAIPITALDREKDIDLDGVIKRVVAEKAQSRRRNDSNLENPVRLLSVTFQQDKIDMVIFELGRHLPFAHRVAVELLMVVRKLPFPVLLSEARLNQTNQARGPVGLPVADPRRKSMRSLPQAGVALTGL